MPVRCDAIGLPGRKGRRIGDSCPCVGPLGLWVFFLSVSGALRLRQRLYRPSGPKRAVTAVRLALRVVGGWVCG